MRPCGGPVGPTSAVRASGPEPQPLPCGSEDQPESAQTPWRGRPRGPHLPVHPASPSHAQGTGTSALTTQGPAGAPRLPAPRGDVLRGMRTVRAPAPGGAPAMALVGVSPEEVRGGDRSRLPQPGATPASSPPPPSLLHPVFIPSFAQEPFRPCAALAGQHCAGH